MKKILDSLAADGYGNVPVVCIGGINRSNCRTVLLKSRSAENRLSGIAVVSAIIAAASPQAEAEELLKLVQGIPPFREAATRRTQQEPSMVVERVQAILKAVHDKTPLSHNMTNLVVQNFAANVALAIGASPIMANYGEEAADLAKLGGALEAIAPRLVPCSESISPHTFSAKTRRSSLKSCCKIVRTSRPFSRGPSVGST